MRFHYSVFLYMFLVIPGAVVFGQELEQFRLRTGGEPIQAKPLSWDFQNGVLALELPDGTTREVAAGELHSADMRLIERLLGKQLIAGRRGDTRPDPVSKMPAEQTRDQADRMHGVRWFTNGNEARGIASGKDGSQDDKPLVWFRVLGDLTGFM